MFLASARLTRWIALLLVLFLPSFILSQPAASYSTWQEQKQNGFSFAAWSPGLYSSPDADQALAELRQDGVAWLSLIVTRYQDTIASTTIYAAPGTPTDDDLRHIIAQAHNLGMKVMLKPHLDLANDPTHWRGDIGSVFNELQWADWFASYTAFIEYYAQLAQDAGADQFCAGTELVSTQWRTAEWRAVIAGMRAIYTGPLTYAANHGSEGGIGWWDALDYIGVDAYYPLTDHTNPTLDEVKAAWTPLAAGLQALSETWGKTVLFTEVGYRSQDGANMHPWDYSPGGVLDLQEQADLYRALLESVYDQDWFAGVYWWSWDPNPFQGGPCDLSFSPHDKPAEAVLREWYGAPPKVSEIPGFDESRTAAVYTDVLSPGWQNWSWGGVYDFAFPDTVAAGTAAISAQTWSWGAVALHYDNFDTTPYYWLEMYVYKTSDASSVVAFANNENDKELRTRPVEDCRYTGGVPIVPGVWTQVRIPLADLNASHRLIQRFSIGNYSDQPFTFYVDEIRLAAGEWKRFLPLVVNNRFPLPANTLDAQGEP